MKMIDHPTGFTHESKKVLSVRAVGHTFVRAAPNERFGEVHTPMAKSRKATPVTLSGWQRERLERLWFVYGNHGPKTTPGNHQFIQGMLEHGIDIRPLQTKRTAKRDVPTAECVAAVEEVLATEAGEEGDAARFRLLRLVPAPAGERQPFTSDPELKRMIDEMRRRLSAKADGGGLDADGEDAA